MASIVDSEGGNLEAKDAALEFATYEDYLDSQISQTDMYYLEVRTHASEPSGATAVAVLTLCNGAQDEDLARQLVELGYRGSGETLKREEFAARKKQEREKHLQKETVPKPLYSMGKDLANFPFLQALANREELVRNGKLTVRAAGRGRGVVQVDGWLTVNVVAVDNLHP